VDWASYLGSFPLLPHLEVIATLFPGFDAFFFDKFFFVDLPAFLLPRCMYEILERILVVMGYPLSDREVPVVVVCARRGVIRLLLSGV